MALSNVSDTSEHLNGMPMKISLINFFVSVYLRQPIQEQRSYEQLQSRILK